MSTKHIISDELANTIVCEYVDSDHNQNQAILSKKYNLPENVIVKILKSRNVYGRLNILGLFDNELLERIKHLYVTEKLNPKKISGVLNIKEYRVVKCLEHMGVARNMSQRWLKPFGSLDLEEIKKDYLEGKSVEDLVVKYNVAKEAIYKLFKKENMMRTTKATRRMKSSVINLDFFKNIDTEEKAYWLGFIVADGGVYKSKTGAVLTIEIGKKDEDHLKKLAKIFNVEIKSIIHKREFEGKECIRIRICSGDLVEDLISIGVVPNKTVFGCEKVFDHIPPDLMRHFVRGFVDGDGWVMGCMRVGMCGSKEFLEKIVDTVSIVTGNNHNVRNHKRDLCVVTIDGHSAIRLLNWLYVDATVFLERKRPLSFNNVKELLEYSC